MARWLGRSALVLVVCSVATVPARAQTPSPPPDPPYRFSGLVFGDYYGFVDHHLPEWDGQQGFWLRRIYFAYDHTFSPQLTTRIRLEMNSNGRLEGGVLAPYIKDAYLRWTFTGRQHLTIGIQPSLTFEFVETVWGLRHIEKPPLDLYRVDTTRDAGFTVGGPLNTTQTVRYQVQYGNDSGTGSETDKFKALRFATRYERSRGPSVELMVAQFYREQDADRTLAQVLAAYRTARGRVGFQYSFQKRRAAAGTAEPAVNLDIYSAFGVYDVRSQKLSLFVRVDRFNDPCADCAGIAYLPIDVNEPFTLTIAGLEYYLHPAVRLSPNIEYVAYDTSPGSVTKPTNAVVARLTFYWVW